MASKLDLRDEDPVWAAWERAPVVPMTDEERTLFDEGLAAMGAGGPTRTHDEVLATVARMRAEQGE